MEDGRNVRVEFTSYGKSTKVKEIFEAENTHPIDMQRTGWQAILDHFKSYVENSYKFERLRFETAIRASAEKVYQTMLDPDHFATWTAPFNPTSRFKGTWEKGSKIIFLGTDEEGNQGGMVSKIRENIPGRFVLIEHLGVVQGNKEITHGPEVEEWAGATERYFLTEKNGETVIQVDMDVNQEFKSFFLETWPNALTALKTICES